MSDSPVNPYQVLSPDDPAESNLGPLEDQASEVTFRCTQGSTRHAIDHLLLHRHPIRLSVGSLLMIMGSGWAIFTSVSHGTGVFFLTLFSTMLATSAIYTMLVYRSKSMMRKRIAELGLVQDSVCVVAALDNEFVVTTSTGVHRWKLSEVVPYRTPWGVLMCPEPMTPIYVPKKNNSPEIAFRTLRQKVADASK
jgi:hypothetical protein